MGVSKKVETAIGMGFATTFVLTLASVSSYLINTYILVPFEMESPSSRSRILENNTNTKEKPIAAPKPYTADAKNPLS
jgi:hypothetical protein